MSGPDEAILGYLLHLAAEDLGGEGRVVKGVGMHAYITVKPWEPEAAKAASAAAKARARKLLEKVGR